MKMVKRSGLFILGIIFMMPFLLSSVYINEFVVDPQTDWDTSGSITTSDEWFEFYNDGVSDVDLIGWNLSLIDTTSITEPLSGIVPAGGYYTLLNPTGSQNMDGQIILYDNNGTLIDSVTHGSYDDGNTSDNAPDGNANDINDECLARDPNGVDTGVDSDDFIKTKCTFNSSNSLVIVDDGIHNVPSEYATIQEAIDTAVDGDVINVSGGTYEEDLVIPAGKDNLEIVAGGTTIKGVANVDEGDWPLAAPNIQILSDGVKIHGFTIESPDYEASKYSSGIVIGAEDVEIYDNEFIINSADSTGEISQVIQTYSKLAMPGVDISGLKIYNNNFTHKGAGDWGYEAIYINPDEGIGTIHIEDNNFNGKVLRAITSERSRTTIKDNKIITDLAIVPNDWSSAGAYQGINIIKYDSTTQSNILIENNIITGSDPSKGFNQGIRLGQVGQGFSGIDVIDNTISYNKNGIQVKVANSLFVNYNDIVDNTDYGILNEDSASLNALYNWWGDCSGPFHVTNNAGGQGNEVSDNIDFTPWLGICIVNKSENPCAFETEDITLSADLISSDIDQCWISYNINGTNYTKLGAIIGGSCQATILASELVGGQNITWNIYANDSIGNEYSNGEKTFYIRERTFLGLIPWPADGLNNWFITEPTFTLTNDLLGGFMYYQWDAMEPLLYTGAFGLDDIPNAPPKQSAGTLEINWWSNFGMCGNETQQSLILFIDLTDPSIGSLIPSDGSTVINNLRPEISAYIDEVFQSNSGVNKKSIILKIDDVDVTSHTSINTINDIDAEITYTPMFADLSVGTHEVYLYVEDKSGRSSEINWSFEIEITNIFTFEIHSPVDDSIYDSKRVRFNLSASEDLEVIEYINWNDRKPRWKKLCKKCDDYGYDRKKLKSFKDGKNNISIRATDEFGQTKEQNIEFFVDSKAPKISRILPKRNTVTNGSNFYIKYTENNLREISVNWNPAQIISDCNNSGKNQECDISIDLGFFDGEFIDYYFEAKDDVHTTQSKEIRVKVDTTSPILTVNIPGDNETYERRVPFNIQVSEDVKLEYIDDSVKRPRWKRLCSKCDEYGVEREKLKSFKRGTHDITIRAVDKAGNSDEKSLSFVVDY